MAFKRWQNRFFQAFVLTVLLCACRRGKENPIGQTKFDTLLQDERVVEFSDYPNAHNPGLIDKDGLIFSFRYQDPLAGNRSRIGMVRLDDKLVPSGEPSILGQDGELSKLSNPEDARLFVFKDQLYAVFTESIEGAPSAIHVGAIQEENGAFAFGKITKMLFSPMSVQKNWVPIPWADDLYFIYLMDPLTVIKADLSSGACEQLALERSMFPWNVSPWQQKGHIRGGTQLVSVGDDTLLGFFHSSIVSNEGRHYFAGAYLFRPAPPHFYLTHISPRPISGENTYHKDFNPSGIIFPAGLVRRGDELILAYGIHDSKAVLAKLSLSELKASLVPLQ